MRTDNELIGIWDRSMDGLDGSDMHPHAPTREYVCQMPEHRFDLSGGRMVAVEPRCAGCLIGLQMRLINGTPETVALTVKRDDALRMLDLVRPSAGACPKPPRIVEPVR